MVEAKAFMSSAFSLDSYVSSLSTYWQVVSAPFRSLYRTTIFSK